MLLARGNTTGLTERRIAVLGSYTLDYLPPLLARLLEPQGVFPAFYLAGFNQWRQELLSPDSALRAFKPEAAVLVIDPEDLFPALFEGGLSAEAQRSLVGGEIESLAKMLETLPACELFLVVPPLGRVPGPSILSSAAPERGQQALELFLMELRALPARLPSLHCVDLDFEARREGLSRWTDDRLWYLARMRLSLEGMAVLASLTAAFYEVVHSARPKVLAVDLDNTLWGGVAGEEGLDALELGSEGIGLAFADFQREHLRLRASGLLLALCSRNDEKTAWEVFEKHPGMVLKKEHFSAWRINWGNKSDNLKELALELNLSLDSFVFLDDDPVQRAEVRARLPVLVPELPEDPCRRPRFLRELPALRRTAHTDEDAQRSRQYAERAERERLRKSVGTLEEFLESLEQTACILPLSPATVKRAAQLCGQTNQFNLTTRRYSETELSALLSDPGAEAFTLGLKDRFGDNGIVGFAILRYCGRTAEIDTFLLSCRVLGRRVEDGFLSFLRERAGGRGASLLGRYIPTERNGQVKDFYKKNAIAVIEGTHAPAD